VKADWSGIISIYADTGSTDCEDACWSGREETREEPRWMLCVFPFPHHHGRNRGLGPLALGFVKVSVTYQYDSIFSQKVEFIHK
jgi:hypothetical protein